MLIVDLDEADEHQLSELKELLELYYCGLIFEDESLIEYCEDKGQSLILERKQRK